MVIRGRCDSCTRPLKPEDHYCRECGAVVAWKVHEARDPSERRALAFLLVHLPGGVVRKEPLAAERIRIGRSDRCELVVEHPRISRHHATLERDEAGYRIRDERSTGGTFVNDDPVHAPRRLRSGDVCRLGRLPGDSVSLVYHEEAG